MYFVLSSFIMKMKFNLEKEIKNSSLFTELDTILR